MMEREPAGPADESYHSGPDDPARIYLVSTTHADKFAATKWLGLLDQQQLIKLDQHAPARRQSLLLSRMLLRFAHIQQLPGVPPEEIEISEQRNGPPLVNCPTNLPLQFSISHSHQWVAVAIQQSAQPIGLDIELGKMDRDFISAAELFCSQAEIRQLAECPDLEATADRFYRLWTCHEARFKYLDQSPPGASSPITQSGWLGNYCIALASGPKQFGDCLELDPSGSLETRSIDRIESGQLASRRS